MERSIRELGRPSSFLTNEQVGELETKGLPKTARESDRLIVLRDGCAVHTGKGPTGIRSLHRKH
jgi:hypothetical protein